MIVKLIKCYPSCLNHHFNADLIFKDNDGDDDEDKYDDDDPRKPRPKMPPFDPSKVKDDPMSFLKLSKKGKVLMLFVGIADNPTKTKTEEISARWQSSLHNAHLQVERFVQAVYIAYFQKQMQTKLFVKVIVVCVLHLYLYKVPAYST